MTLSMDISVSFLKCELASTIDQAVRCAVDTVLKETARVVGVKLTAARTAAAESHRENQSLRERLEISESELKAVRYYMTAAEKNIKQCLLLNQNQPRSNIVRPAPDDTLFHFPQSISDGSPSNLLNRDSSRKSFRSPSSRAHYTRTLPSVGLCLPTVQSEWPRSGVNRRRIRASSIANTSVTNHIPSRQVSIDTDQGLHRSEGDTESQFFITDDGIPDKELAERPHEEQGPVLSAAEPSEEACEMGKFEFEMGAPAGNVNELGLIQVLEDTEAVKESTVKIEDDSETPVLEPTVPEPTPSSLSSSSSSSQVLPQMSSPSLGERDGDAPLLGFVPPIGGDIGPLETMPVQRDSSDKVHRCNVCGRGFRRFYCLKTHQRIHTGERPYPCRYCEKRFRHLDSLHKHQRIHTGERPYRCAQCGCCFRELGQLKKHRLKHSPVPSNVPHPSLSLLPAGPSYVWPHVNSQSMDSA
ncbi:zinc finger protein 16-like isoform X2 [Chanos chanos]|uniref:Zinc finger protein 16-like isoform X2 n=1 Tax=Chanos chanos TaxID=29144 RepID=A0A6J2VYM4_CHACN|nr:zinc finger protein 16-like isoform X2 [Chanos chanos]